MLELRNVSKSFRTAHGAVLAVRNANLVINNGDIFGIIGFSGAGKSTLVRCINLLERPESGEVLVNGKDITRLSNRELRAERRNIGMIFQHFNLFRLRTVAENIAFPLRYTGMSDEAVAARVKELLELVSLSDKSERYPAQLSGGQKQRVGIARALASNPSILLCDEATSALDPQTTHAILELLAELNKKLKLTIVIITHEMTVVKTLCTHAALMDKGEIVESGSIFDIFSNPKHPVTKDFIATTSPLNKIYNLIEENSPITQLKSNQRLAHFYYSGRNTVRALIAEAALLFGVKINIIFGDLDIIQHTPVGGLINILEGGDDAIDATVKWFGEQGVRVEYINVPRGSAL